MSKKTYSTMRMVAKIVVFSLVIAACSTTKNIPDDDQLFIGLTKITYERNDSGVPSHIAHKNFVETQTEVEAALATAPNGALFGSSYYRTPFPYGLWVWNAFSGKEDKFSKWMTESFGKKPVLMSWVNPALRAQVAQSVMRNRGYFHGRVDYTVVPRRNPKKAKIGYHVSLGPLLTIDTLSYEGFPNEPDSLIRATYSEAKIHSGDAFTADALDAERTRISTLFRNSGYYYYQPAYASYLADTISTPGKAQLRLQLADSIPAEAMRKFHIGNVSVNLQKSFRDTFTDSLTRRRFTIRYQGEKSPLRPRVVMGAMRLRPGQPYRYNDYLETANALNATGLFSMTNFTFSPRNDTLDLTINAIFERPWDVYAETNLSMRTIGRIGPELRVGVAKRNLFRGDEKLDLNLHGSYEWQIGGNSGGDMNTYNYGIDVSLEFPRIVAPFMGGNQIRRRLERARERGLTLPPRRWRRTATTLAKVSSDIVRRPNYYKMHIVSGEWTYRWSVASQTGVGSLSKHELSLPNVKYQFMNTRTNRLDSIMDENPILLSMLSDYFIPQIRYTYTYTSGNRPNPIRWEISLSESGNLTSLGYLAAGRKWNEKDKKLFKNPYAQFLKLETDFTKTWQLGQYSQLVGHVSAGVAYCFGNTEEIPFSERFYVGGANSVRAFSLRSIGPGKFSPIYVIDLLPSTYRNQYSFLIQNGDVKFVANLEYRTRLFGNLNGAVFLDAGNVWFLRKPKFEDEIDQFLFDNVSFRFDSFYKQLAVGTGIGLRYDLDFLVLRLDWGLGLHVPYDTSRRGFFNTDSFKRYQTLHFAIGYPF